MSEVEDKIAELVHAIDVAETMVKSFDNKLHYSRNELIRLLESCDDDAFPMAIKAKGQWWSIEMFEIYGVKEHVVRRMPPDRIVDGKFIEEG